jgi:chromate transporter
LVTQSETPGRGVLEVFSVFLHLGLTSFGGPVAHLGFFRQEFVTRRRWLDERAYADLVALCQFLPGPASSQVGFALGLSRAGLRGALAAWAGFTLPSALALIALSLGLAQAGDALPAGVLHGLKLAAVAVVAQAVWGMARALCQGAVRATLMVAAAVAVLWLPGLAMQFAVLAGAAAVGLWRLRPQAEPDLTAMTGLSAPPTGAPGAADPGDLRVPVSMRMAGVCLAIFMGLLLALPLAASVLRDPALAQFDAFYRAGALVFGGGHVVLPLLEAEVVASAWVPEAVFLAGYGVAQAVPGPLFTFAAFLGASMSTGPAGWAGGLLCLVAVFLAGYGVAQAVPGPLFTFAAFLGASMSTGPAGWAGGLLCLVAVFLPGLLLVLGTLPFWAVLRRQVAAQAALAGVNAAVVGWLLAALFQPVWSAAVQGPKDVSVVLLALLALTVWKTPPWAVVLGCGALGWALQQI